MCLPEILLYLHARSNKRCLSIVLSGLVLTSRPFWTAILSGPEGLSLLCGNPQSQGLVQICCCRRLLAQLQEPDACVCAAFAGSSKALTLIRLTQHRCRRLLRPSSRCSWPHCVLSQGPMVGFRCSSHNVGKLCSWSDLAFCVLPLLWSAWLFGLVCFCPGMSWHVHSRVLACPQPCAKGSCSAANRASNVWLSHKICIQVASTL